MEIARLYDWDEWPGPEDEAVLALSLRQQGLYDLLIPDADPPEALQRIWDQIHDCVVRRAATGVPFDPNHDAWHRPTTAVCQAAFTAGSVGLCLACDRPVPQEIEEQWHWFLKGHWPCGYHDIPDGDGPGVLVVF